MATTMMTMKPISPQISQPTNLFNKLGFDNLLTMDRPQRSIHRCLGSCEPKHRSPLIDASCQSLVNEFNPRIPIQEALTPPSSWYTDPSFHSLELNRVFYSGWQAVGYTEQIKEANSYFTGRLGNVEYVVCRDDNGELRAFHNVCRHHASLLAFGSGEGSCFVCPYHGLPESGVKDVDNVCSSLMYLMFSRVGRMGWMEHFSRQQTGIKNFNVNDFGLVPMRVAVWGPFILLDLEREASSPEHESEKDVGDEWLGSSSKILSTNGIDSSLSYLDRHEYTMDCNWKVFCDNYMDGGYHVPYAHKDLAAGLKLETYSTTIYEKVSIQSCDGQAESREDFDRIGSRPVYAFVYPNFMINRYGPWMDTNLVIPLGPRKCKVIFDYFLEASLKDDKAFVERSLNDSRQVQMEDIMLCESVQRGLESPVYRCGRYAPAVEKAMHHFHCLLHDNLVS